MLALAVLALSITVAEAAEVVATMPAAFIGEWNAVPSECGDVGNDSSLKIEAQRIAFWNGSGPIKAIVVNGGNEVAMIAEMTGDGMSWLTTAQFRLSGDGQQLIAPGRLGSEIVRYRCPNAN